MVKASKKDRYNWMTSKEIYTYFQDSFLYWDNINLNEMEILYDKSKKSITEQVSYLTKEGVFSKEIIKNKLYVSLNLKGVNNIVNWNSFGDKSKKLVVLLASSFDELVLLVDNIVKTKSKKKKMNELATTLLDYKTDLFFELKEK